MKHRLKLNRNFIFRKSNTDINTDADTENWRDATEPAVVIAEPEPEPLPEAESEPEPEVVNCDDEIDDEWKKQLRTPVVDSEDHTVPEGIDGIPPPKIILSIENPDKNIINPDQYEKEIDCKLKQGYMFQVDHFDVNTQANQWQVHARAVFLVLNAKELAVFANENVNALIQTQTIKKIQKTQKVFDNSVYCFEIFDDEYKPEEDDSIITDECYNKPSPQSVLTLCAPNEQREKDWVNAIANYKTCDIRMVGQDDNDKQAKFDILSAEHNNLEQKKEAEFDAFTQQLAEQQRINSQFRDTEENETRMVQNKLEEIRSKVKMANAKEDHELNAITQDKEKLQIETEKLEEEKRCLEQMLMIKEQEEDSEKAIIMKEEQQANEEKLLDEATECILKTKDKEENNLKQMHEDFVKKIKIKQDSIKEEMVKETIKAELNTPADECFSDKIEFQRNAEMKQICGDIAINNSYDAVQLSHCLVPSMFCEHCCGNHYGSLHQEEQKDCNKKCEFRMENAVVFDEVEGEEEEEENKEVSPESKYINGLVDGEQENELIHYESKDFNDAIIDQKKQQISFKRVKQLEKLLKENHQDITHNDRENSLAYRHQLGPIKNGFDKVKHEKIHGKRKLLKKK